MITLLPVRAVLASAVIALLTTTASADDRTVFIEEMTSQYGFDADFVSEVIANAETKQSIIDAMSRPAEKVKPWYEYRDIFITDQRINEGVDFWMLREETLQQASERTGVPMRMIAGIVGVETYYGRITGNYRVVDALSTLAFDYPPRATFFRNELKEYFLLSREEQLPIESIEGSYAGAMGPPQFIPSSYRAYAVDGDGDGRRDLLTNWDDILNSVGNYFKAHRWHDGEEVAIQATLPAGHPPLKSKNERKANKTLGELRGMGLLFESDLPDSTPANLIVLEGRAGPEYWIGLHNFYVITRYNHSVMYGLAAYQLGEALAERTAEAVAAQPN
ncbi:MAG: lytic murein transglycosylase B [Gammaproteobacteria bacterium]|jgi:membrane-bound lytic murein transglycosylase B|nr:lytic murein transglycosylase B [Gammaproteobacteria bacterium]